MTTTSGLIADVLRFPNKVTRRESRAADELVAMPFATAKAIHAVLLAGWTAEAHPYDIAEALSYILGRIYIQEPSAVEPLLNDPALAAHEQIIRWGISAAQVASN
jgi:hypothetical protein